MTLSTKNIFDEQITTHLVHRIAAVRPCPFIFILTPESEVGRERWKIQYLLWKNDSNRHTDFLHCCGLLYHEYRNVEQDRFVICFLIFKRLTENRQN